MERSPSPHPRCPLEPIPASRSVQTFRDSAEQERGLAGWSQRYVQSEPGAYRGAIDRLTLPGLTIWRERLEIGVEQSTAPPEGKVIFVQALAAPAPWRFNAEACAGGLTGFIRGGEEHLAELPAGTEILMVEADAEAFAADQGVPAARMALDAAFLALPEAAEMRALAEWFVMLLDAPGAVSALIPELAFYNLGKLWQRARFGAAFHGAPARHDYRLFRRAETLLRQGELETPSVTVLARELGVPVAELRRAFAQSVGIGPVDWLRRQRFDGARRELRAASEDTTVTAVAMKWGFVHLGRFSTGYAAQFGETPSATLRTARAR